VVIDGQFNLYIKFHSCLLCVRISRVVTTANQP
jgi:hypothetical protein